MPEDKSKTLSDEQTLANVLQAAYVLQERNRELQRRKTEEGHSSNPVPAKGLSGSEARVSQPPNASFAARAGSGFGLAQIVEIQQLIQSRHLGLEQAMSLVTERLAQIAGATSAAIGILDDKKVRYRAAAGVMALPTGTEVPVEKALGGDCLRTGQAFLCADINSELHLDKSECDRRGIQSMIAVPVFQDGGVGGCLEVYFPNPKIFAEEDVHACQLMAGLVSEALARSEEVSWKKSMATERAMMLEALEKLKPNLAALADTPIGKDSTPAAGAPFIPGPASRFACWKCGHELVGQEQFCGNCGSRRKIEELPDTRSPRRPQDWTPQDSTKKRTSPHAANSTIGSQDSQTNPDEANSAEPLFDFIDERGSTAFSRDNLNPIGTVERSTTPEPLRNGTMQSHELREETSADFENDATTDLEIPLHTIPEAEVETPEPKAPAESTAMAKPEPATSWASAATALNFLEQLSGARHAGSWAEFWNRRRGDFYLAIAVVLVLGVIRWGLWSDHNSMANPKASSAHRSASPDADLSLFDRILVKLGLAEAPEPLQYKGNPRTQVWVDLQTALYYCPGADLYGKTSKGKLSSQRDAQLDQFEPAYRRACD